METDSVSEELYVKKLKTMDSIQNYKPVYCNTPYETFRLDLEYGS
jgi:hypothetical protein